MCAKRGSPILKQMTFPLLQGNWKYCLVIKKQLDVLVCTIKSLSTTPWPFQIVVTVPT